MTNAITVVEGDLEGQAAVVAIAKAVIPKTARG